MSELNSGKTFFMAVTQYFRSVVEQMASCKIPLAACPQPCLMQVII